MTRRTGPFIGVTGFMSQSEVREALKSVPHNAKHRLMVGVLVSDRTLAGLSNKWPRRYPTTGNVADIFVDDPRVLNLIHYNTHNPDTLYDDLMNMTELVGGRNLHGFQLNVTWPNVGEVYRYRQAHPEKYIVLQVGSQALHIAQNPEGFRKCLGGYIACINAVLIDPSGGQGKEFNPDMAFDYLQMTWHYKTIQPVIAGGLGPRTLHLLNRLIPVFPNLSIDAEGQVRDQNDDLSCESVRIYAEDAFPKLAGKELPGIQLQQDCAPYGLEEHVRRYGGGDNMLRTETLAQPAALKVGDKLATGDKVLSKPREAGNGGVWLHLEGGIEGHWISVPRRIPIALAAQ